MARFATMASEFLIRKRINIMWELLAVLILAWGAFSGYTYFSTRYMLKKYATVLTSEDFSNQMSGHQIIDLREPAAFKAKHVLGARNIQYAMLKENNSAIRKDQPAFLYDANMQAASRLVKQLAKQGYTQLYVLKGGFQAWQGKTK
jgi:rhodanese-related sulfurtransferase